MKPEKGKLMAKVWVYRHVVRFHGNPKQYGFNRPDTVLSDKFHEWLRNPNGKVAQGYVWEDGGVTYSINFNFVEKMKVQVIEPGMQPDSSVLSHEQAVDFGF